MQQAKPVAAATAGRCRHCYLRAAAAAACCSAAAAAAAGGGSAAAGEGGGSVDSTQKVEVPSWERQLTGAQSQPVASFR
jgi:hypothetical protein